MMRILHILLVILILFQTFGCGDSSSPEDDTPITLPPTFSYDGIGIEFFLPTEIGGYLSVLGVESVQVPIYIQKTEDSIPIDVTLQTTVNGISIQKENNDYFLRIDGEFLAGGSETSFTILVTNTEKDLTVEQSGIVAALNASTPVSKILNASGGELVSSDGSIALVVDPGELSTDVELELVSASSPTGEIEVRVWSPQDLSNLEANLRIERRSTPTLGAKNYIHQPSTLNKYTPSSGNNKSSHHYPTMHQIGDTNTGIFDSYWWPIDISIGNFFRARYASNEAPLSYFTGSCEQYESTIPGRPQICINNTDDASALYATKPEYCFETPTLHDDCSPEDLDADYQPVLFVHGFYPWGGLGGGESTWGGFLDVSESIELTEADAIVAFEFRWHTNASFRVVGDELASAISRINELTGRPVHIVAHSFGGILVRTILKNQTYNASTDNTTFDTAQVLSVLTLGTPHSGIYDKPSVSLSGQTYPAGQDEDAWQHEFCVQISCWQMGESLERFVGLFTHRSRYDAGERGEHLDRISTLPVSQNVPMVVGIGLALDDDFQDQRTYRNGDRLISYDGQRISPTLVDVKESVDCDQATYGPVTEIVLGVLDGKGKEPDTVSRRPEQLVATDDVPYAHSLSTDKSGEYVEPHVTVCAQSDSSCVRHAAEVIFEKIVLDTDLNEATGADSTYCVKSVEHRNPTAPIINNIVGQDPYSLLISWSESANGFSPYTYSIFDVTNAQEEVLLGTTGDTSFLVSDLEQDIQYCYQVAASDRNGLSSSRSDILCGSTSSKADATEGWLEFESGNPGVPNDGVTVAGENCPSTSCTYREFTPTERIRLALGNSPITISAYPARFGFFLRFRLAGYPEYCSSMYFDDWGNGDTPPYDGIPGRYLVIDEAGFLDAVNTARNRYPECTSAPINSGYISRIDIQTGGIDLDGAYLAYGENVFPEDNLPPITQVPGWVSFYEGNAGVPDDGIVVLGQASCQGCDLQHTIVEELTLGSSADGLTLNVYGTAGEALDEAIIRYSGYPEECNYSIPLNGQLPNAPSIRGVAGKYLSLSRSQLASLAQVVAASNPSTCSSVSVDDTYYAVFLLSGNTDLVDGAFVGVGTNSFPSE